MEKLFIIKNACWQNTAVMTYEIVYGHALLKFAEQDLVYWLVLAFRSAGWLNNTFKKYSCFHLGTLVRHALGVEAPPPSNSFLKKIVKQFAVHKPSLASLAWSEMRSFIGPEYPSIIDGFCMGFPDSVRWFDLGLRGKGREKESGRETGVSSGLRHRIS